MYTATRHYARVPGVSFSAGEGAERTPCNSTQKTKERNLGNHSLRGNQAHARFLFNLSSFSRIQPPGISSVWYSQ